MCIIREFQIDREHGIRVRLLRERNEVRLVILHRHDWRAVHRGGPHLRALRQRETEVRVAATLHKVAGVGEHLSFFRDARGERGAIHDLAQRIALRERTQCEFQIEWPRSIAICSENRRVEKQPVLRRHFARLQRQQSGGFRHSLHVELIRTDHQRVPLLGLRIERTRAGECQRVALRLEGPLIRREQRVGAGDRRVQLHDVSARDLLPVADVFPGELDVEVLIRQLDLERRDRSARDDVVQHTAPVRHAFADGEKMERVRLDGLRQPLDLHRRLPRGFAQTVRRLDARDLARKKRGRDFRERLRALGGEPESRVRRHRDVAAHRLRLRHVHVRQHPVRGTGRLVAFEPELHDLPARNRLRVHESQLRIVLRVAQEIIAQARDVQLRDRVALRHAQQQFAQRRLAHINLDLRVNALLTFTEVECEHLRDRQLGQDLIGLDAQREIRAGKTVRETLPARRAERRLRRVALGKLLRRNLRESPRLHDFEPHRALVHDAEISGETRRALGPQLHRVRRLRERADGRLRLHENGEEVFLRLVELHGELALARVRARLDAPREHLLALHARDLAFAAQQQRHAIEFALHHLAVEQRHLPHQPRPDADLREHFRGVEKFSLRFRCRSFPRELHRAIGWQEAREVLVRALGPRRAGEIELRVRGEPLQEDRLQRARRDAEIHRVPSGVLPHRRVEFERNRKVARLVEHEREPPAAGRDAPVGMRREFRQREAPGEQRERAALWICHARCGGERECGALLGELAGELEIAQHHLARLGIGEGDFQRQRVRRSVELKCERLRFVGLGLNAHRLRHVLRLDGKQAARCVELNIEFRRGFHAHKSIEERGLRRREGKNRERVFPCLHVALGSDDHAELCDARASRRLRRRIGGHRLPAFFRTQDERARTARFPPDAPILQPLATHLLDLPLAANRQRKFFRLALQNVERQREPVREPVARDLDGMLHRGREDQLVLVAVLAAEQALDDEPHLSIRDSAADGRVLDFRVGLRRARDPREQGDENDEGEAA